MGYKPPSLKELQTLAKELKCFYKGSNKQRITFLSLFNQVTQSTRFDMDNKKVSSILLGALVYELEFIKEIEYKGFSPEKNKNLLCKLTGKGSSLYTKIKEVLKISEHTFLNDDQRLIYLNQFYWYIKNKFPNEKKLPEDIITILKNVKKRESKRIGIIAEGTPVLGALQKNIIKLTNEYENTISLRLYQNPKRIALLKFINLINQTCDEVYHSNNGHEKYNFINDLTYMQSCNVRSGAVLLALLSINDEYKSYKFLSPERSKLFKECLHAINIKKLNKIDRDKKIEWLRTLALHVKAIKSNNNYYKNLTASFKKNELTEIEKIFQQIEQHIGEQELKKISPSWTSTIANNLIQYGLGFAATQYTADILLTTIGGTVGSILSGPAVLVMYLTGGTLLITQFGRLVSENIIPKTAAYLYTWVLEKVGTTITNTTADVATYTFSATKQGLHNLLNHPALKSEDKEYIQDWIDTLLALPDEVMSEDEKNQIKNVLDMEVEVQEVKRSRI